MEDSCLRLDCAVFVVDFFPCFHDLSVALATIVVFLMACQAKMFVDVFFQALFISRDNLTSIILSTKRFFSLFHSFSTDNV